MAATATRKTRNTQVDPNESLKDRFKRLATMRVNKAIREIRSIGQLAAAGRYEYDDAQVEKIATTLRNEVELTIQALEARKIVTASSFSL